MLMLMNLIEDNDEDHDDSDDDLFIEELLKFLGIHQSCTLP